jgi:hypothetical protein
MTQAAIRKRFGKANSSEIEKSTRIWRYNFEVEGPGSSIFYFRNGRVVEIYSMYLMC